MLTLKSRVIASAAAGAIALSTVGLQPASADGYQYREGYRYQDGPPPATYDAPPATYEAPPAYVVPPVYGAPPVRYDNGDAAGAAAAVMMFGTIAAIIASKQRRHRHYEDYEAYGYGPRYGGPVHLRHGKPWRHNHHR